MIKISPSNANLGLHGTDSENGLNLWNLGYKMKKFISKLDK